MKLLVTNDSLRRKIAMDPDIEPMAGGGESLIGDDYCPLCTHLASQHHAEIDALRARIAELQARLSRAENVCKAAGGVADCFMVDETGDFLRGVWDRPELLKALITALAAWRAQK